MYMVNHMSRSNALVVSQAAIAKGIGAKRESVNRAVRYLVEHNFIQVIKARWRVGLRGEQPGHVARQSRGTLCSLRR